MRGTRIMKQYLSITPAVIFYQGTTTSTGVMRQASRMQPRSQMASGSKKQTASITINTPLDPSARSGGPNVGFGMRWQGHSDWDNIHQYPAAWNGIQPRVAWYPLVS